MVICLLSGVVRIVLKMLHVVDLAADARRLHEVALAERAEQHQHHAGGEIAQRVLQGQADGQAGGADYGEQRGHREAERIEGRHDDRHQQDGIDDVAQEIDQGRIDAGGRS